MGTVNRKLKSIYRLHSCIFNLNSGYKAPLSLFLNSITSTCQFSQCFCFYLILILFLRNNFKLSELAITEAKRGNEHLLPCTSAFAMVIADCVRILFSPHSFILGIKRKIVSVCINVNDAYLVLMVLLQISMGKALKTKDAKKACLCFPPLCVTLAGLMEGSSCLPPTTGRNCWEMRARLSQRSAWIERGN